MTKKTVLQIVLCVVFILSLVTPAVPGRAAELQTFPPTIDGILDAEYGPAVATDPAGDSLGGNPVDLTNLWVTEDATHLYVLFEVNTNTSLYGSNWGKYVLYLDTTGDASGATDDAWGRAVAVADPHRPEFSIYTYMDAGTYGLEDTEVYAWIADSWQLIATVSAAASVPGVTSMVEWSIPKSTLDNPNNLWVELWSTGGGGTDNAQDTINFPSNDWQAPNWGTPAILSVCTPIMHVDGVVEPQYGAPLAADPAGDGYGNPNMDLLNLYVTEDASQYYFAYSVNAYIAAPNWGKYVIYIDTTNNSNGATTDAWGRNTLVNDPHKPEFAFYTFLDSLPYGMEDTQFWAWSGTAWVASGGVNEAALVVGSTSIIEWAVEKNRLGNPDTIWLEVWDTSGSTSDNAQDTINDPADDWNASDWSTQAVLSNSTQFPKATEPPHASYDNNIWWNEIKHDSRDTLYRTPGGPVPVPTEVTLRLRAAQGDLTEVKLRLYNDRTNVQTMLPMSIVYSDGTYDWWQAVVPASPDPTVFWYRFVVIDGTDTDYYEDDAARTMGWGQAFDESPDYSYQLTVYDSGFRTPDWIKNAIVYQVFPDRFRDGDSTNNKPAGTFFYNEPGGTVYRSLGTEWNTPICDPRGTDGCAGSYSKNFYGGDLQGLIDKIDYLQNLGVTAIYLNPIFESPSNHGYDTTDYMAINPMFGDAVTFNTLTAVLQARGMHLILDGVFNHVSSDSIYFDRYENFEELGACESITSPYRSWFYFTDVPAGTGPCVGSTGVVGGATYESWWGYDSLPKLNSTNPQVRALIWESDVPENTVAGHWMQFADGWRLDVGADVDPGTTGNPTNDYWEGFRKTVKTVNPEGYITGEEWGIANSWLLGGEWDAVMNYQFSSAVLSLWRDEAFTDNDHNAGSSAGLLSPLTPEQFDERILNLIERYSPEALQAMLNLFGSHDTSRALFMLDHNTDLNDPTLYANPAYDWTDAINRLKGAVAVQMTMPGAPTIYYGDEVGLVGPMAYAGGKWEDDPYNRQPFPWLDEGAGTPFYTHLQSQPSQDALRINYLGLAYARNAHPALRTGDYRTLVVDNTNNVYAYGRNLPGEDSAVVLINRATTDQTVTLDVSGYLPNGAAYGDVFSSATYIVTNGQLQNVTVSANRSLVLVLRDSSQVAPPAPVVLSAIVNGTDVNLNWTASAGRYLVYRTNLYGGGYELIAAVTGDTFYTDKSLPSGQRVYYIVVVENTTTGLLSINSNEVSAIPAYIIGWANLQWPFTISHTIGITPTENIYGQVWINGVTSEPGATPGLIAQVGYGPNETDPRGNASWIWFDAAFNGQVSNNDEFVGALLPEAIGVYDYIYRYSTNGAVSWEYAYEGEGGLVFDPYNAAKAGDLTVNASSDVTPPSAPVLTIEDWSASSISLSWSPVTDGVAVYAYDLYRSTNGTTFNKIDRVLAATLTYFDTTVVTDQLYYYYVIALDTSFNPSVPSNTVSQIAEAKLVAVKFEVTVPAWTPGVVYIVGGNAAVGNWNPGAVAMTKVSDTLWTLSADILDGTAFEFKITRGNWETVMKGLDGNEELANLSLTVDYGTDGTQTYSYTVLNWRDPIVVSTVPLHETVDVALNSSIVVTWSQVMAASACPEVWVGLDPTDLVAVTCSFDSVTNEMTITPTSGFPPAAQITVGLSSLVDLGGDAQQVSAPLTFRTDYLKLFMPLVTR